MLRINASIYFITFYSVPLCYFFFILRLFVIWISLCFNNHIPVFSICCGSFAKIAMHYQEVKFFSPHFEAKLGHLTCFGQWDTSKHEMNKDLKSTCTSGLALFQLQLGPYDHNVNDPELAYWIDHLEWSRAPQLDSLLNTSLVSEAILDNPVPVKPLEVYGQVNGPGKTMRTTQKLKNCPNW